MLLSSLSPNSKPFLRRERIENSLVSRHFCSYSLSLMMMLLLLSMSKSTTTMTTHSACMHADRVSERPQSRRQSRVERTHRSSLLFLLFFLLLLLLLLPFEIFKRSASLSSNKTVRQQTSTRPRIAHLCSAKCLKMIVTILLLFNFRSLHADFHFPHCLACLVLHTARSRAR